MNPRLLIERFEFFAHPTRTRFPFRYGIASMTEVPHLFVRCRLRVEDRPAVGLASEGLPPKWFTKDPQTTFEADLGDMFRVIDRAAGLMVSAGQEARTFFELWKEVYDAQTGWASGLGVPALLSNLGVSLCERAVLDGLCRALDQPIHRLVQENRLGLRLGAIHAPLGNAEPRDLLPSRPGDSILIRHTLGLADPLTPADIPAADRVNDGLPQDLESCVRSQQLRAFKFKLAGDPDRDTARLQALRSLLAREMRGAFLLTLDGNENFQSFAGFRDFWERLRRDPVLEPILANTVAVEQPVHRSHALDDDAASILRDWENRPTLIIDESDGALGDLPRALSLGYAGTSHKNCKGIVKGIANACLLEQLRRQGRPAILTGEDLCNLGPVALLQDLALMTLLGVPHVERNGHHYYRGLSPWPEDWQERTRAAHPDLYVRDPLGFVRVEVSNGMIRLNSVNAAPFGVSPLFDPSRFPAVELSCRHGPL